MIAKIDRFMLFQDSSGTWCAAPPGFRDLCVDPTGWDETRERAIMDLWGDPDFRERAVREGWPQDWIDVEIVNVEEPGSAKPESAVYLTDNPYEQEVIKRRSFRVIRGGKVNDDGGDGPKAA